MNHRFYFPKIILSLLLLSFHLFVLGQGTHNDNSLFEQLHNLANQLPLHNAGIENQPNPNQPTTSTVSFRLSQIAEPEFFKKTSANNKTELRTSQNKELTHIGAVRCKDTSFTRLLGVYNGLLFVKSVTETADGGLLIPVEMIDSTRLPHPTWRTFGLLIKLDKEGNFSWIKQFEDVTPGRFSSYWVYRAFELSNGDIICSGFWTNDSNLSVYKTVLYRLSSKGDIIWKNCLQSNISIVNGPPGTFNFIVESAIDGLNGDVILGGTTNSNLSSGKIETVVLLNSQGQLVWDANYGNHGVDGSYRFGAEGVAVYMQNGKIVLVGLSHGISTPSVPPAINFFTLDYQSGHLIDKRFFRPSYADRMTEYLESFTYYRNRCLRLNNGHFLFYGKLYSGLNATTTYRHHFGVVEFDNSFNLIDAYIIGSEVPSNYSNDVLHFNTQGKGLLSLFSYIGGNESDIYFGSFYNRQFSSQRKVHYSKAGLPGGNGFAFFPNEGYAFVQSYFDQSNDLKSYIEFRKMHDSDTSSVCMGKATSFFSFGSLNIIEDPSYYLYDQNDPNKFQQFSQMLSLTDTISTTTAETCRQTSFCDTIKIHGESNICGSAPSLEFTAFKNAACGASVQWQIDNNAIDSMRVLTDTSVRIWFKNANWQGRLHASLPGTTCYQEVSDVMDLSVVRMQTGLNLGEDTVLCVSQLLTLKAGDYFTQYEWQDGSTASSLEVTKPGFYWVHTRDGCGNRYADSILVRPYQATIDIGPDRIKCNSDTLHLQAPSGFLNYTWNNNYQISSLAAQNVVVSPLLDTAYFVKAEKTPGCFAYDTVLIKVYKSPLIDLGADQKFCKADSVVLSAGSGFTNYIWSNGSINQSINVKAVGTYSVMGTTTQGCKSYDTMHVVEVYPLPVVQLDQNEGLCKGETRTLDAGNFVSYQWQDGSSGRNFTLRDTGLYTVRVTDINGCTGSGVTKVSVIHPVPQRFLPDDTTICSYGKLELKAASNYKSYLWSNGASAATISVTQPGMYWLQVKDNNNCVGRDTINIGQKQCLNGFYVPTAFTPNRDGKNDFFRPLLFGNVQQYQFTVYNRWGQVVFQTTDLQKGWDGKLPGLAQDGNVFVWSCTYQFLDESVKYEKGTVTLIR